MKRPEFVTQALMVVLIGVVLWMGIQIKHVTRDSGGTPVVKPVDPGPKPEVKPDPQPEAPVSPLAKAAVQYRDRLGPTFATLRDQVKDGRVQTKRQAADLFAVSRKPLGAAMNDAVDAHCDKSGQVTDADGLAADLDRAAKALGAK